MTLLRRHPQLGIWVFSALLLLCACFAHATNPPAACSTAGGGAGQCFLDCKNGSNSPGQPGTFDQPWRSPVVLGTRTFAAGDAVYFKRDCTWNSGMVWTTSGTSGAPILLDSYGGNNTQPYSSGPGTGAPPRFTGWLPIAGAYWCKGAWSVGSSAPVCTVSSGSHIWQSLPLFDAASGSATSDGCTNDHGYCVPCPSGGFIYSCLDQALAVLNYARFGTVWGNDQEYAVGQASIAAALTEDRDWYFDASLSAGDASRQSLFVYCTCTGGVTPDVYYGQVVPIAVSNELSPINGGMNMLNLNGVQWVKAQHLLFDWYDSIGIFIQGASDHIWLANLAANSYVENGQYRFNSNGALCVPANATGGNCSSTSSVTEYSQAGLLVNEAWSGSGTPFTDIHAWNDDFNMNYVGVQAGPGSSYACAGCALDLENDRMYANRTYGVLDNLGGAARLSYSHLYGNNLATALETDVQTNFDLPNAALTCSAGVVTATFASASAPAISLTLPSGSGATAIPGEMITVNTASASGLSPLASAWSGTFQVLSWGSDVLTWGALPGSSYTCPASSSANPSGGSITLTDVNDQGNNLNYVSEQAVSGSAYKLDYSHLQTPFVQAWQRWPAYVTFTYDDPGLVQYSDNYVAQVLPIAAAKLGASNFSIAVVTGGAFSGLNINGGDANSAFVAELEGWLTSGYDVLTHSTSHSYWAPPASSCGTAAIYRVPCHIFDLLRYTGSIASTATLTISHNSTTCAGLGVSSTACFVIQTSPSDASANLALDISAKYPWTSGASSSVATLLQLQQKLNAGPFVAFTAASGGASCGYVCFDTYSGDAAQALSHSLDDTYSSYGTLGAVNLMPGGGGFNLDFHTPSDTAAEPPYFEADEMGWAAAWTSHYLTAPALPEPRLYVMPGTYGDSASEQVASTLGFSGVRGTGSLKPCCAANTTLANGYDKFNILSEGINPNLQNLTYGQMRALFRAEIFRNALWGRPIGFFWHINELPYDQVQAMFDAAKLAGATILSNTGFLANVLLNAPLAGHAPVAGQCAANDLVPPVGVGDKGSAYVAGSFYACPSTGVEADWRETVNSPTIGKGTSALGAAYQYDLKGNSRNTYGTGWDIGSFQYIPMSMPRP